MNGETMAGAAAEATAVREERNPAREALHSRLVLGLRWRMMLNSLRNIRAHMYVHFAVGIAMIGMLFVGGTALFTWLFRFLMRQEVFGAILMDSLVGLVLLIFFALLTFSNLIIMLSTTYLSREVEFLMAHPIGRAAIFRLKLLESTFYSSWAFAVLSLPLFISYGIARQAEWYYYPLTLLLIPPFIAVPAGAGAIVTMVLTAFFPARKTRTLCVILGILCAGASLLMGRLLGIGRILRSAELQDFGQVLNTLSVGTAPLLPSAWFGNALRAIGPPDAADISIGQFVYWFAMLASTALFLFEVTRWLAPRLYYKGWTLSRDNAVMKEAEQQSKFRLTSIFDRIFVFFPPPVQALLSKDLKTFWRDPSQWTQIVILLGLMTVYIGNIRSAAQYNNAVEAIIAEWKLILIFFNMAASCFILSILTTRFVFPMLSLEGRQFWTVGMAPLPRTRIVWQKYLLCFAVCLVVSHALTLLSNRVLDVSAPYTYLAHALVTVLALGLTSLSVGLSAILPNFREDNPARIANGVGGTLNVLVSLAYIACSIALLVIPFVVWPRMANGEEMMRRWGALVIGAICALHVVTIWLPMRLGLARWRRHEF